MTFAIDTNPNYTNVCITDCQFCAFYRKPGDPEAYTLTVDEVMAKIAGAVERGATTVLLQGGHNPALPLDYYLDLVRETRRRFPGVLPHFFTASEIQTMARVAALPVSEVLARLRDAGQRTLPGGRRRDPLRARAPPHRARRRAARTAGSRSTARRTGRASGRRPR